MQPVPTAATAKSTLRQVLAWSPVFLAMAILAQVALLGLRPAVAERRRIAEAEQQMRARVEREELHAKELERVERAQNDPIYLERERRALEAATPDSTEAPSQAPGTTPEDESPAADDSPPRRDGQ